MNEQKIRERAHAIWEREGRPEGREQEHWERAKRELRAEGSLGDTDPTASREAPGADASSAPDRAGDRGTAGAGDPANSRRAPGSESSPNPGGAGDATTKGAVPAIGKGRKGGGSKAGASAGSTAKDRARRGVVGPDA